MNHKTFFLFVALIFMLSSCKKGESRQSQILPMDSTLGQIWKTTADSYPETANLDSIVTSLFGNHYRIADWHDLIVYSSTHSIEAWADSIGMKKGDKNGFHVTCGGQRQWGWFDRYYFIERHEHDVPNDWLAYDNIDNHYIDLGSWKLSLRILCIRK